MNHRAPTAVQRRRAKKPEREILLTKSQLVAWATFGPEWDGFKAAWLARGFRHPPSGSPTDDPEDEIPSQRALLWSILDARPGDLVRWIGEAPAGGSRWVIDYVLARWHYTREEVPPDSEPQPTTREARSEAAEQLGTIFRRIAERSS